MLFINCIDEFKRYLSTYAAADTIEYYNINLDLFSTFLFKRYLHIDFDINFIKKNDYIDYISFCRSKDISDTSAATYARAIKVFLKYCYREGFLLHDLTLNVKLPKNEQRLILPLTKEEVNQIHEYLYDRELGFRNLAIMYLMLGSGLRRSEVVKLNCCDISTCNNYIRVHPGKNKKSRVVPLSDIAKSMITLYQYSLRPDCKCIGSEPLFLDRYKKDRITNNTIELVFQKVKVNTGIKVYPHLFRHTFATSFILGGGNLEMLRLMLGHSSYNVTQQYLHIANDTLFSHQTVYPLDKVFFECYKYTL